MSANMSDNAQPLAPNANTLWAKALVDELARSGLRSVCISPGSRSTPLVVQFAEHPDIEDISIVDERSAGFFALGLAQASGCPVALVCTSGTAAANFFPAICEANSAGVPLLVLTADRPPELQDCGASQAMDQLKLYGDHVRWFHQLAQPEATPKKLRYVRGLACRAYQRALAPAPGPVHLNVPFRKPLEPLDVPAGHPDAVPDTLVDEDRVAALGRADGRAFVNVYSARPAPDERAIEAFQAAVRAAKRPIILAGADPQGAKYRQALCAFAERIGAPILAEPTSGLRHFEGRGSAVISTADCLLASKIYERHGQPDLLIRTGRAPLLWSAQAFIRSLAHVEQIVVGPNANVADPDHITSTTFTCDERLLFEAAHPRAASTDWLAVHRSAEEVALDTMRSALGEHAALSAPRMWHELGELLPRDAALFVSNSMPIRNFDTFMCHNRQTLDVFFNRGLNGIDGITSTGLGIAAARRRAGGGGPTVIVTGDVALRHDISGLLLAGELGVDATIIVVDNDGGGIFDYLPIADFGEVHTRHFTTAPARPLDQSTIGYVELVEPKDWDDFRVALTNSLSQPETQLIRVRTDRGRDRELREGVRQMIAAKIDETMCDIAR